jgi:uncharacterized protein
VIASPLLRTLALAAGLSLAAPGAQAAPSFDCAKASTDVEKLICSDAELAKLDHSLADLYGTLLKHTPAKDQQMLKAEQRGWVKGRNECWKSDDMRGCVAAEYRSQIAELKDR